MREYEEQLNNYKKENLNLKLRIYFMEEQQGMLSTKQNPENVYKVNIDLKVHGEELKKASVMIVSPPVCSSLHLRNWRRRRNCWLRLVKHSRFRRTSSEVGVRIFRTDLRMRESGDWRLRKIQRV